MDSSDPSQARRPLFQRKAAFRNTGIWRDTPFPFDSQDVLYFTVIM
jgi:hypothetical protein